MIVATSAPSIAQMKEPASSWSASYSPKTIGSRYFWRKVLAACGWSYLFVLGVLASNHLSFAQTVSVVTVDDEVDDDDEPMIVESDDATRETPAASAKAAKSDSKTTKGRSSDFKARRLQMIRALTFDRRPSIILKAWHEPPPPDFVPKPESSDVQEAATEVKPTTVTAVAQPTTTSSTAPAKASPVAGATAESSSPSTPAAATPDAAAAAKQAEITKKEQAAKQEAEAKRKAAEDAEFKAELTKLQRQVTLGEWSQVQAFLTKLDLDEAKPLYQQMVTTLHAGSMGRMNIDPNVLQQLVSEGADLVKIQQTLSQIGQGPGSAYTEKNLFTMPDLLGLMLAAPEELDDDVIRKIGQILQFTIAAGFDLDTLLNLPPVITAQNGPRVVTVIEESPPADALLPSAVVDATPRVPIQLTARDIARLLCGARQEARAGEFLPTASEAAAAKDGPGLNLIARHVLAKYSKDQKTTGLEQAWQATQSVLELSMPPEPPAETKALSETADSNTTVIRSQAVANNAASASQAAAPRDPVRERYRVARAARDEALNRAVELVPKVRKELGQQWLHDCFQTRLERGKEILRAIGSATSSNLSSHPQDQAYRKRGLELQKTAVDALLKVAKEQPDEWKEPLTVVAVAWLKEAQVSHALDDSANSRGWRRDRYGNFFMFDDDPYMSQRMGGRMGASPIKIEEVLEVRPNNEWLSFVTADLQPKFPELLAQLYLKMQDDSAAFPYIERLAATHPARAKDLAEEFVRVWTSSHNPNERRDGYNPFYYYWSYERRADRIPLTRSKQERNLVELADLVKRLKALPIGDLNETLLTNAFTTAHSKAEVYRLEAIENVFGSVDVLKPRTLAELIQQMRGNLAGVWRMPDTQRQNNTNRKQRDIRAEVLHGYGVARKVTQNALLKHPDHWALLLAQAAILHDEIDYEKEAEKSSDFSQRRNEALALFGQAAQSYVRTVSEMTIDEQTVLPFEMWFYASLGSADLARITADKVPDLRQPPLIRDAIASLPGEVAERHLSQFANNLFTRASDAKPELKHRYLRAGFEIVGEHKLAREARKLLEYYGDLITEIKLETKIDGPDTVGHQQPFGVFVNLVHTKEIERESGGFGKYLQNQNNTQMYFYNFGRPLENYRDKFRDFAQKTLSDHFDVLSITFQEASVNSRALPDYGWRTTPYAYLLLKPKGPEVDKLPSLRMDLDFLDTSGYALLPIESPALPLDAKPEAGPSRPASEIVVTQTLDERQSKQGKLLLEIRATARGLAPEWKELLELNSPGFRVDKVDDRALAVLEFDKDSPVNAVRSERQWTVTLVADNAEKPPTSFVFAKAKLPLKEHIYQRYEDADLKEVPAEISLIARYSKGSWTNYIVVAIAGICLLATGVIFYQTLWRKPALVKSTFELPETLTPFTVIGFLHELKSRAGFDAADRDELQQSIVALERHYFQDADVEAPNFQKIANQWLERAINSVKPSVS